MYDAELIISAQVIDEYFYLNALWLWYDFLSHYNHFVSEA